MKKFSFRRLYFKILHSEGTPKSIARGVAIGLTCGLIIPIGLQTFPALFLAFLLKANKVLTWSFTCVTNPASVIVIYPFQCWIGSYLVFKPLSMESFNAKFQDLANAESLKEGFITFCSLGWDIILPFFAGGILFAVIAAPAGYIFSYKIVDAYQKRKAAKRKMRLQMQKAAK